MRDREKYMILPSLAPDSMALRGPEKIIALFDCVIMKCGSGRHAWLRMLSVSMGVGPSRGELMFRTNIPRPEPCPLRTEVAPVMSDAIRVG